MLQDIRSGALDLLTPGELSAALHEHFGHSKFSDFFRKEYAGIKLMKLPVLRVTATATSFLLASTPGNVSESGPPFSAIPGGGGTQCGPESGFIWQLRRVLVSSNVAADTASWGLYVGSDFSVQQQSAVDLGGDSVVPIYSTFVPVSVGPALPVSATTYVNANQYPVTVTLTNTAGISAVNVNGSPLGAGIFTFAVPAGGTYSVTWTVTQPTATTTAAAGFTQTVTYTNETGLPLNRAYYPANKSVWVWPEEEIYASITGATIGNTYLLTGVAIEVPAIMQGKLAAG